MQISDHQQACSPTNSMAPGKVHIPSFGEWNMNQNVTITEYFDSARSSRVKKEDSGNGHAVPGSKGQVPIHQHGLKSSSISKKRGVRKKVPTAARPANRAPLASIEQDLYHIKPEAKKENYQRIPRGATAMVPMATSGLARKESGGSRTPSPSSIKTGNEKSSANKKPSKVHIPSFGNWNTNQDVIISEYFDIARASRVKKEGSGNGYAVSDPKGQVPVYQSGLKSSANPKKQEAHAKVPTSIRPTSSAPLPFREQDLYHVKPGAKKEIYRIKSKSSIDMDPMVSSAKMRREYAGSRTPSPSSVRREYAGSRTPSPSSVRREYAGSRTPSPSSVRTGSEKSSANKKATKKKALPKFGDWDLNDPTGGTPFTTIFDEARKEKRGAIPANKISPQRNVSTPIDEDLYKQQSSTHKNYREKVLSFLSKIFSGKMICQ